ncbi:MAG: Maf family protein [Planctomycetota bacterium]
MKNRTIILASGSPRRRQLLKKIITRFEVVKPRVNEEIVLRKIKSPVRLVQTLAKLKARSVYRKSGRPGNGLIIAADTVVWTGREIITKPRWNRGRPDKKDAFRILKKLSGTRHSVITGVSVLDRSSGRLLTGYEKTVIRMKKISDAEIRKLVNSRRNLDKAGGYAIQESGDPYIRIIKGSKSNVVGLPLKLTRKLIHKFFH